MKSVAILVEDKESPFSGASCELQESLPLFPENIFSGSMRSMPNGLNFEAKICYVNHTDSSFSANKDANTDKRTSSLGRQDHLACAKRLSKAMRLIPSNSRQHIQAGRLVCHHLVAMLHESPVHRLRVSSKLSK